MADNSNSSRHVSYEQVKTIIDFMGQHVEFATGSLRTLEARHTSKRLWNELTKILNNLRSGTKKSSDGWSKYWSDFKNKLKNKVLMLKKKKRSGDASRNIRPLTRLEKRALVILGPHFEKKTPYTSKGSGGDRLSDIILNACPPEVKLETSHENGSNEFCHAQSGKIQVTDDERDSDHSNGSNEESGDESDITANEPIINSFYPKWLIEVEKKRADAELLRAKGENQRTAIASRNSEVALIQAEALKKLAEAASKQADAMLRIAIALERRSSRDDSILEM